MTDEEIEYECVDADGNEWPEHDWCHVPAGGSGTCPVCDAELIDEAIDEGDR
jgi:hypothetical protein